jgi:CheY-like chemotaxis protein/HPt (histidine-containing phosphotransfer) domain-containing protein
MMPEMDGFQVAERIREQRQLAGATIMMLSSADRHGEAARCRELGIVRYLVKPIKQSDLLDAILAGLAVLPPSASAPVAAPSGAPAREALPAGAGLRILLVEDNATNQMLVLRILEKQGHAITVANNGREALENLKIADFRLPMENPQRGSPSANSHLATAKPFDLVLMDVQMPELDGLEATAAIRAHEKQAGGHIPILAMTAHAMKGDREECLAAGMDGYLSKPIQPAELRREIAALVGKLQITDCRLKMQTEESISPSAICNLPSAITADEPVRNEPKLDAVDRSAALAVVGGDVQLLKGLIQSFLGECPDLLANLRAAVAAGDGRALHRAAHTIKGAVNLFGAQAAWDEAQRLEMMGRENDFAQARQTCAAVENQIERVKEGLAALLQDTA